MLNFTNVVACPICKNTPLLTQGLFTIHRVVVVINIDSHMQFVNFCVCGHNGSIFELKLALVRPWAQEEIKVITFLVGLGPLLLSLQTLALKSLSNGPTLARTTIFIAVSHMDYWGTLRATSHTILKAHDHCNLRALIGRKVGD
jgi:hypothetical protein